MQLFNTHQIRSNPQNIFRKLYFVKVLNFRTMRVLHITKKYLNAIGGDARVVSNLEREQSRAGHKVFILTSNCDEIQKKENVIKFGLKMSPTSLDKINLKRVVNLALLFIYSFYLLRKLRPDIVHSHSADMGFFVSFAARIYKIPILNTCHGVTFLYYPGLKGKFERFFLRHGFDAVITVDRTTFRKLLEEGIRPVYFLPNGVNLPNSKKIGKRNLVNILFVGRLERQKGLEFLFEAARVVAKDFRFTLYVVGEGSMREFYEKLSVEKGLRNVEFMRGVSDEKLNELYRVSDIFVLPSLWEGMPISVLEAWSHRLAVIATEVGDVPHLCTNFRTAVILEPGNTAKLADAIKFLIDNPSLRRKLGWLGHKHAAKFDWRNINDRLLKIYHSLAKTPDSGKHS